ncbi:MAG: DUF4347 domain-containing protein [Prochloraceae cyanobacterium]|nr:DUF4347 domain-containing protein [Prochloraceae cyanobacterium]
MKQLLLIDTKVENYQFLVAGVVDGTEVIIIDPAKDRIKQINNALHKFSNLNSIHIVSHGSPGCLYLGNTELSLNTLNRYAKDLKTWFSPSPPQSCSTAVE